MLYFKKMIYITDAQCSVDDQNVYEYLYLHNCADYKKQDKESSGDRYNNIQDWGTRKFFFYNEKSIHRINLPVYLIFINKKL